MYHIFYRMKHSSAILNTHSELSKIRFFANILEIDPIRYLHRLLKNVCKNWIDRVTLWWEYRFEWVFCYILLRLTFTMKRQNESWKSIQLVTLIFGSRFIYESVILLYCLSYRKKYRLIILWIFFPLQQFIIFRFFVIFSIQKFCSWSWSVWILMQVVVHGIIPSVNWEKGIIPGVCD